MTKTNFANSSATLYLVATPIGNLDDISIRAGHVLQQVSKVYCEDTNHSKRLFTHLKFLPPLVSFYQAAEVNKTNLVLQDLAHGQNVALISSAGLPLVNDPGQYLVRQVVKCGYRLSVVGCNNAALTCILGSGFRWTTFSVLGFLPKTANQLRKRIERQLFEKHVVVFYESPHRILKTLQIIETTLPPVVLCLGRELTKYYETYLRGTPAEVISILQDQSIKGEFTCALQLATVKPDVA